MPKDLYCIAMDVGHKLWRDETVKRGLLFGAVIYNKGTIGEEPVRSQGHIHAVSSSCGYSTCEVYEIWEGKAAIYMQERADKNPGQCYAVIAEPGDIVIVPPGWVHATINMDIHRPMAFGAWCIRDYGFEYKAVKDRKGIAFYPIAGESIRWEKNPCYNQGELIIKTPKRYKELGICSGIPIYQQFCEKPDTFQFVYRPRDYLDIWKNFEP